MGEVASDGDKEELDKGEERAAVGLNLDNGFQRKYVRAAAAKDEAKHYANGEHLRDSLDEDSAGEGHGPREYGPVVIDTVHLGLFQRWRSVDYSRFRLRNNMFRGLVQGLASSSVGVCHLHGCCSLAG